MEERINNIREQLKRKLSLTTSRFNDQRLRDMFENCFYNTLDKTIQMGEDEVFVITGDIPAMWLRDSSAQLKHYIPFAKDIEELQIIIESVLI